MPTERRPNFFIVGAQKSGTSSLAAQLGLHPQVFMSFPKEPGYLAFGDSGYVFSTDTAGRGRRAATSSRMSIVILDCLQGPLRISRYWQKRAPGTSVCRAWRAN